MPDLKFKRACNDCPFLRKSLRGWTGAAPPEWFTESALADYADYDMPGPPVAPCHQTIDYSDPDWKNDPEAAACVGSLVFARNNWKSPRDPERSALVQAVERDSINVFDTVQEFIDHHRGGEFKSWEEKEAS